MEFTKKRREAGTDGEGRRRKGEREESGGAGGASGGRASGQRQRAKHGRRSRFRAL